MATQSQPHTGKYPTNFPYHIKALHHVMTSGTPEMLFPYLQLRELHSHLTCKPKIWAPFNNCSGSLQISPNLTKCCFTQSVEITLSPMYILSIYADVVQQTDSDCTSSTMAFTIAETAHLVPDRIYFMFFVCFSVPLSSNLLGAQVSFWDMAETNHCATMPATCIHIPPWHLLVFGQIPHQF